MTVDFVRSFARWCDELDERNASPLWWSTSLASRHPLTLTAPRRLRALARGEAAPAARRGLRETACALLPLGPLAAAVRAAGRMLAARLLTTRPRGARAILFTLAGPRSFAGGRYADQFFGPLPEFLEAEGRAPLLWAHVTDSYVSTVRRLPPNTIPLERSLTWAGLARATATALRYWARGLPVDAPDFEGKSTAGILAEDAAANVREGRLLADLLLGEALRGLCRDVEVLALYYPFENLARERSLLRALREERPGAPTIGYQHAPLTLRQLNLRLGGPAGPWRPVPDVIVASGPAALERLRDWGWPAQRLRAGCALRASAATAAPALTRPLGRPRLLVLLSQGSAEYEGLLRLLDEAFGASPEAPAISLRPHPVVPLEPALRGAGPMARAASVDRGPLGASLTASHAVLYASSAAALDAARAGVPAIWADWGDWLPADPLEGIAGGRFEAKDGPSLRAAFAAAAGMGDEARAGWAAAARGALDAWTQPVTGERLRAFLP